MTDHEEDESYLMLQAQASAYTITESCDHMVEKIEAALRDKEDDLPLVVFVGEVHTTAEHVLTTANLIRTLSEKGISCHFAKEAPYTQLRFHLLELFGEEITSQLLDILDRPENADKKEAVYKSLDTQGNADALLSNLVLEDIVNQNGLPKSRIDVVKNDEIERIEHRDPATLDAIKAAAEYLGYNPETVLEDYPDCLSLAYEAFDKNSAEYRISYTARNIFMLDRIENIRQSENAPQVIVVQTGRAHVFGLTSSGYNPLGALNMLCIERDIPYLGFPLFGRVKSPEIMRRYDENMHAMEIHTCGVDFRVFDVDPETQNPTIEAEAQIIRRIIEEIPRLRERPATTENIEQDLRRILEQDREAFGDAITSIDTLMQEHNLVPEEPHRDGLQPPETDTDNSPAP